MSNVNIDSILSKIEQWKQSDAGKKKIKEAYKYKMDNGNGSDIGKIKSGVPGAFIDKVTMSWIAEEFIGILKETAEASGVPTSVAEHFDSLKADDPVEVKSEEMFVIDINFMDKLSRLSLFSPSKNKYTGDGINNIVALFDTGYTAGSTVYGLWNGHEELGTISSRQKRDGLGFIDKAINSFNAKFGSYGVTARINDSFYSK